MKKVICIPPSLLVQPENKKIFLSTQSVLLNVDLNWKNAINLLIGKMGKRYSVYKPLSQEISNEIYH